MSTATRAQRLARQLSRANSYLATAIPADVTLAGTEYSGIAVTVLPAEYEGAERQGGVTTERGIVFELPKTSLTTEPAMGATVTWSGDAYTYRVHRVAGQAPDEQAWRVWAYRGRL